MIGLRGCRSCAGVCTTWVTTRHSPRRSIGIPFFYTQMSSPKKRSLQSQIIGLEELHHYHQYLLIILGIAMIIALSNRAEAALILPLQLASSNLLIRLIIQISLCSIASGSRCCRNFLQCLGWGEPPTHPPTHPHTHTHIHTSFLP